MKLVKTIIISVIFASLLAPSVFAVSSVNNNNSEINNIWASIETLFQFLLKKLTTSPLDLNYQEISSNDWPLIESLIQTFLQGLIALPTSSTPVIPVPTSTNAYVDIKANGSDGLLNLKEPANYTLTWTSQGVRICNAYGDWSGQKLPSGSEDFKNKLAGTYTYSLSCYSYDGGTVRDSVTIEVSKINVPTTTQPAGYVDIKANGSDGPLNLKEPANYTLTWTSQGVNSCNAYGSWVGSKPVSGSQSFSNRPAGTYNYGLSCKNGTVVQDSVTINVFSSTTTTSTKNILYVQSEPITGVFIRAGNTAYNGITNYSVVSTSTITSWLYAPLEQVRDNSKFGFDSWSGCDRIDSVDPTRCYVLLSNGEKQTVIAKYKQTNTVLEVESQPITNIRVYSLSPAYSGTTNYKVESTTTISTQLTVDKYVYGPSSLLYKFDHWEGCDSTSDLKCNISVPQGQKRKVIAVYKINTKLEVRAFSPLDLNVPIDATPSNYSGITNYVRESESSISATLIAPEKYQDYVFINWTGCYDSMARQEGNKCIVNIPTGKSLVVGVIYRKLNTLNVQSEPVTGIPISSIYSNESKKTNYTVTSTVNISDTLIAPEKYQDYVFDSWEGCDSSFPYPNKTVCNVLLSNGENQTVIAHYKRLNTVLEVESQPITNIKVYSLSPAYSGTTNYKVESTTTISTTLTAIKDFYTYYSGSYRQFRFDHWEDCDSTRDLNCNISVPQGQKKKVVAVYVPVNLLWIHSSAPLSGVPITASNKEHSGLTSYKIESTSTIADVFTAPKEFKGYTFVQWGGSCYGTPIGNTQCSISVSNGEMKIIIAIYKRTIQ